MLIVPVLVVLARGTGGRRSGSGADPDLNSDVVLGLGDINANVRRCIPNSKLRV